MQGQKRESIPFVSKFLNMFKRLAPTFFRLLNVLILTKQTFSQWINALPTLFYNKWYRSVLLPLSSSLGCLLCRKRFSEQCPSHGLSYTLKEDSDFQQRRAITSLPPEVSLCMSSIPGAGFGVCTKKHISEGTWIGPFEGKRVQPDNVKPGIDTSFMWEVSAYWLTQHLFSPCTFDKLSTLLTELNVKGALCIFFCTSDFWRQPVELLSRRWRRG